METKKENGYGIFLMYQLAISKLINKDLEYDLAYAKASVLYEEFENSTYNKDESKSEGDAMMDFIEDYATNKQRSLMRKIQSAGVNVVSCGHCGNVFLHDTEDGELYCPSCESFFDPSDCPDLYY